MNLKNHPKGRPGGGSSSPPPEPPIDPPEPPPDLGVFVGFGKDTTGGTGGSTTTVSTWAAAKAVMEGSGARILAFTAGSYNIDANGDNAIIDNDDLTIDGTGWTGSFKRQKITIKASNVIATQVRFRPGDDTASPDDTDGLTINPSIGNSLSNIVIDRCSILWGPDVTLAILNRCTDITVQHSILGCGLRQSAHSEASAASPGHGYGPNVTTIAAADSNVDYGERITFYRNYIMHNYTGRNIRGLYTDNIEYVNNVVYNWGKKLAHINPRGGNYVGTMMKKGPGTQASNVVLISNPKAGETSFTNSVYWPTAGADANIGIGFTPSINLDAGVRRTALYRPVDNGAAVLNLVTATSALADQIVDDAGPTSVDVVDQDLKDNWTNGDGSYFNGEGYAAPNPYWP